LKVEGIRQTKKNWRHSVKDDMESVTWKACPERMLSLGMIGEGE